jgi:histidine phosphotransferase ChpT
MKNLPKLTALELAALLASRVCHDIISPVGAINNGLEVLEEDNGEEMKEFAMDLIRKSAISASSKLKFARLAFGASGSAGAMIDTGDAEEVARAYVAGEKPDLDWIGTHVLMPKNKVKLLLNLILVSLGAIPRGGMITVLIDGVDDDVNFTLTCVGRNARAPSAFLGMINGEVEGELDAHGVQPYYTVLLAEICNLALGVRLEGEDVVFTAK